MFHSPVISAARYHYLQVFFAVRGNADIFEINSWQERECDACREKVQNAVLVNVLRTFRQLLGQLIQYHFRRLDMRQNLLHFGISMRQHRARK